MDTTLKMFSAKRMESLFALGSALFLTIVNIIDSVISHNYAKADDMITAASAYLLVGGWFGVFISLFMAKVLGKRVSRHTGIGLPARKPTLYAIAAGITAALATFLMLWGNQLFDLGIMTAMANAYILFVVVYEWSRGKLSSQSFLLPVFLVCIGTVLMAFTKSWQEGDVLKDHAFSLLIIFLGNGLLVAYGFLVTKPATAMSDPVNIQIIRFVALAVTGTVTVLIMAIVRDQWTELWKASELILTTPISLVCLLILFAAAFLNQVLELEAKDRQIEVSSVAIVIGANVGLGFLLSLAVDAVEPGYVGPVPEEWFVRAVRLVGVVMLILAAYLIQVSGEKKPIEQ